MRIEKAKVIYPKDDKKSVNESTNLRTGAYMQSFTEEYYNINVNKLITFKNQARKHFDEGSLNSLALTIKEHGIRQPLTVLPSEEKEGFFEVVSGERRLRAALKLSLEKVPCIIIHDRKRAEEIAIIENIQRENLHPLELANAYNQLLEQGICKTTQDISDKLGVHKSSVIENLNLLSLNKDIQQMLLDNKIKARDFLRIICKANYNKQQDIINEYLQGKKSKKENINSNVLRSKNTILNIIIMNENIEINKNAINKLTIEQKHKIKAVLENLIQTILIGRDRDH